MVKKVLAYGVVAVLALTLVGGTAYTLLRPRDVQAGAVQRGGPGQGLTQDGDRIIERRGAGQLSATGGGYRGGNNGATGNGGQAVGADALGDADHPAETWETLTGVVTAVDVDVTIETADGSVLVGLGPEWYRDSVSFTLAEGDEVTVTGSYEDGEFKAAAIENVTTGISLTLRDDNGRPGWAGQGRSRG